RGALCLRPMGTQHLGRHHALCAGGRGRSHRLRGNDRCLCPRGHERMNARLDVRAVPLCHVVKGETVRGADHEFGPSNARFTTPRLDLDQLVWLRAEPGPAFDTPIEEIMDILVATGAWLKADPKGWVAEALEFTVKTSPLPRDVLERAYASLSRLFSRPSMQFQVQQELGGADVLDSWREIDAPSGRRVRIRA